jgi:hypothetical protein
VPRVRIKPIRQTSWRSRLPFWTGIRAIVSQKQIPRKAVNYNLAKDREYFYAKEVKEWKRLRMATCEAALIVRLPLKNRTTRENVTFDVDGRSAKDIKMKSKPAVLHLNLHREFFGQIVAGTKRVEYRDQTPHWKSRLENRKYDLICLRNGYAADAPEMLVKFCGVGRQREGRKIRYAIRLGKTLKLKRWRKIPK